MRLAGLADRLERRRTAIGRHIDLEAELARARASIEARRALSKLNQANGAMP